MADKLKVVFGDNIIEADEYPWGHRDFVLKGAPWTTGERVFHLMVEQGLKEDSTLLDFGCGSLRVGRFLMMYLNPGCYFGLEPNKWLVDESAKHEVGQDLFKIKKPEFRHNNDFNADVFDRKFDFILVSGIMTHMDHDQLTRTLAGCMKALAPGGLFLGSIIPVGGPDHDYPGWQYPQQACHFPSCITSRVTDKKYTEVGSDVSGALWFTLT